MDAAAPVAASSSRSVNGTRLSVGISSGVPKRDAAFFDVQRDKTCRQFFALVLTDSCSSPRTTSNHGTCMWSGTGKLRSFGWTPFALSDREAFLVGNLTRYNGRSKSMRANCGELGMSTLTHDISEPRAVSVSVTDDTLAVDLVDGRTIMVPLAWFPRLLHGTHAERGVWEIIGDQEGIHWPLLDEDISVASLIAGRRSGETAASLSRWLASRKKVKGKSRLAHQRGAK